MKGFLAILFLFISQTIFCQEYYFDRLLEYSEKDRAVHIFMFNSKDSSYVFKCRSYDDNFIGVITDTKNKVAHYYKMENGNETIGFRYLYSKVKKKIAVPCNDKDNVYEVKQLLIDSTKTNFEITRFLNHKKKSNLGKVSVIASSSGLSIFSELMRSFLYHFVYCQKLDLPDHFIPLTVTINYSNGTETVTKLMQQKEISTLLSLKKEELHYKN